jgi:Tol biopolymer transport system component
VIASGDGTSIVRRVDIDSGNEKELYKTPAGRAGISLSPDGETLSIIQSSDRNHRSLLLLPAKGGTARPIHEFVAAGGGIVNHTWFPDGKSIFYIVRGQLPKDSEGSNWIVVRVPVDGGVVSEQTIKFSGPIYGLEFNPNGRLVSFTGRSGASTESEVWVIENLKDELKALLPAGGEKK